MSHASRLTEVKVQSSLDRCTAFGLALVNLEAKIQTSPATRLVLSLLRQINDNLAESIRSLHTTPDLDLLTPSEVERRVHRVSRNIPYLYTILGLIEHADAASVPSDLIAPLRREAQELLPGAELIVVAEPTLNYSISDIGAHLRLILTRLKLAVPNDFPTYIYRVALPSVDFNQTLLHCILAHELGHPLYEQRNIGKHISPIEVDEELVRRVHESLESELRRIAEEEELDLELLRSPILLPTLIAKRLKSLVVNWIAELSCDVFGLCLFGPSYLYAYIYFSSGFQLLDNASESHPPNRLRLRALFVALNKLYSGDAFSEGTKTFLESWQSVADQDFDGLAVDEEVALKILERNDILKKIADAVQVSLDRSNQLYDQATYTRDLEQVGPSVRAQIPPSTIGDDLTFDAVDLKAILNAAWEEYLGGMRNFGSRLPAERARTPFGLVQSFNGFILKCM